MNHKEAFCLMLYVCEECMGMEILWNSRDGVTSFGIRCRYCPKDMLHKRWSLDQAMPNFVPHAGMRYFRDMTQDELREYIQIRVQSSGIRIDPERLFKQEWREGIPFVAIWE